MKRRAWLTGGVAFAAAATGAGIALWHARSGQVEAESALWDLSFEQLGGGKLSMAPLRGHPLLLNFWATWCAPCIREMPLLDRFQREHAASGWQVVGLAVDSAASVREFLTRLPIGFSIGLAGSPGIGLSRDLGNANGALPFTVVFNREGRAFDRKLGSVLPADLARWSGLVG